MVAHYYEQNGSPQCPASGKRVDLEEMQDCGDSQVVSLQGPSKATDADDIRDFTQTGPVCANGWNIKSISMDHQFVSRDNGRTVSTAGAVSCRNVSSEHGQVNGFEVDVSFTVSTPGGMAGASVGGTVSHETSKTKSDTYEYCFTGPHSWDWDNLGGTSDKRAAAFKTNW